MPPSSYTHAIRRSVLVWRLRERVELPATQCTGTRFSQSSRFIHGRSSARSGCETSEIEIALPLGPQELQGARAPARNQNLGYVIRFEGGMTSWTPSGDVRKRTSSRSEANVFGPVRGVRRPPQPTPGAWGEMPRTGTHWGGTEHGVVRFPVGVRHASALHETENRTRGG